MKTYIVCYSGGHSSALVAIESMRRYGKENIILLNHNINPNVEHEDIKRFKAEISEYIGVPITYANMDGWDQKDQFDICVEKQAFQIGNNQVFCTHALKTKPFQKWLAEKFPVGETEHIRKDVSVLYGFDKNETRRINRRVGIMGTYGYTTDYPLAFWERTVHATEEIGIKRPITYNIYYHANCTGCLKAGMRHWYTVYCLRPDIFEKAKWAEAQIGHAIIGKNMTLEQLEVEKFSRMKCKGFIPTEKGCSNAKFWTEVNRILGLEHIGQLDLFPCECSF